VRLFQPTRRSESERLLWSRDIRYVNRLAAAVPDSRFVELDSGACLIASSTMLTEKVASEWAGASRDPHWGLVDVDPTLPERDRYVYALSAAVQASGLADRIGMAQSTAVVQTKLLDLFFHLSSHAVAFQPIICLESGELFEYECLFRPQVGALPTTISSIVAAAIETDRSVELDRFVIGVILDRIAALEAGGETWSTTSYAINVTPASLLDPNFEASVLADQVRQVGLQPQRVTLEVTEQQAVDDVEPLRRHVKALRRAGFGFAVDDAGAGYASFSLIAALRPSLIKIDREIVHGLWRDDAKQALVEAFVSFGRRIGAQLVAEGVERRAELEALRALGVRFGQGFLIGRPAPTPQRPRKLSSLTDIAAAREATLHPSLSATSD
jgi:EAL domain-containing protein (putative c-di-GMP-specific phosphodiesterase class I)